MACPALSQGSLAAAIRLAVANALPFWLFLCYALLLTL